MGYFVVIGGSTPHVAFVKASQKLGHDVVVFDFDADCPCAHLADKFFCLSTHDFKGIEKVCDELAAEAGLSGMMTYSSDKEPLLIVARLAEKYGLPSFSVEAIEGCLDKDKMMSLFKGAVPVVGSFTFNEAGPAGESLEDASYPVIVKPSAGTQGSLGVTFVAAEAQFKEAFAVAKSHCSCGKVIIEEFCEGRQFSVDGITIRGESQVLAVSEKFTSGKEGGFVISGFAAGKAAEGDDELTANVQALEAVAKKAAAVLNIDNSFFNVDLILTPRGPVVIECGVLLDAKIDRLLGFCGMDIYELFCGVATGREAAGVDRLTAGGAALVFFFARSRGTLEIDKSSCNAKDYIVEWERRCGDSVGPPESIADTLGWVVAGGEDRKEAYAKALELSKALPFRVV